ncbi:MAG: hypothetical protein R3213_10035, partial [Flavobacteriaceae bacterium]|nr:hypothetical protein [Flavobacteriaceae bacterium]
PNILYDNTLYFNIDNRDKINVLTINNADDTFLKKIFTEDQFDYLSFPENSVNFKLISEQNLIVLNELENINISLNTALQAFAQDGGSILVIPSNSGNLATYNQLYAQFGSSKFDSLVQNTKRITEINFSHPLLENVFEKKVTNFQYPKVNSYFSTSSTLNSKILGYEDGTAFLFQVGRLYNFTSELSEENSNFKNSPLIVPTLYNIGKQSLKISDLYYLVGREQKIDINAQLSQDEILRLESEATSVIPLQQTYSQKVQLTIQDFPEHAGMITVTNKDEPIKTLSFNYERGESDLQYYDLSEVEGYTIQNSVADAWQDVKSVTEVDELWKWFVIFALIFLIAEILILKYLK